MKNKEIQEINGRFQKGTCPNPNGRPKGIMNSTRSKFLALRKMATEDAPMMYEKLKEAVDAGESWAMQLYFKELISFPKNLDQPVTNISVPKEKANNSDEYIVAFLKGLSQFEEFTQEEILDVLKTLSNLKISENIAKEDIKLADVFSDDELIAFKSRVDKMKEEKK